MYSTKQLARRAGILYLLANIAMPFALLYLPRLLIVTGDATATADRVRASIGLVRAGIAVELNNGIFIVLAALAFYRLFKPLSDAYARAMLVLVLLAVPISLFNILNSVAALNFARGRPSLTALDPQQLDAFVLLSLRLHNYGVILAGIFWGLWLFPFGILAMRSGFIPWWIGLCMFLAGVPYVVSAFTSFAAPQLDYIADWLSPLMAGELPMTVWLLVWGAKDQSKSHPDAAPALT
jgi:Domain of unknown function (DUF4386)